MCQVFVKVFERLVNGIKNQICLRQKFLTLFVLKSLRYNNLTVVCATQNLNVY